MRGLLVASLLCPLMALVPGTAVPKFSVSSHDGECVSSESLGDAKYILWFYPKADTGG